MPKRMGEIEFWLRKIFFGGNREKYVVFIRHRVDNEEELRPIPARFIDDIRRGYIIVGEDMIPFHRVEEIRTIDGKIIYSRKKEKKPLD
jgi:uncharacterized protein (UPF0248 family)